MVPPVPASAFDPLKPNGLYTLDLADPYERQVAAELVKLWSRHGPESWANAKLDGAEFTLKPARGTVAD